MESRGGWARNVRCDSLFLYAGIASHLQLIKRSLGRYALAMVSSGGAHCMAKTVAHVGGCAFSQPGLRNERPDFGCRYFASRRAFCFSGRAARPFVCANADASRLA